MDWEIRGRVGLTCNAAERRTLSAFGLMSSMLDIVRAVQLSFHAYKSGVLRPSVRYISKVYNQEFSLSPGRTTTGEVYRLHPTSETSRKGGGYNPFGISESGSHSAEAGSKVRRRSASSHRAWTCARACMCCRQLTFY